MTPAVSVRSVESFEEYYDAMRVVRIGWRAAFDDILPASALPSADVPADRRERLRSSYEDVIANDAAFVAREAGNDRARVVGFAHAVWDADRTGSHVPAGDAELKALYVRPDRWGTGVGTALLERVESAAPDDADRLVLQTFAENADGRAFYRARGFEAVGEGAYDVEGESYPTVVFAKPLQAEAERPEQDAE